jgi:hypothetical protein
MPCCADVDEFGGVGSVYHVKRQLVGIKPVSMAHGLPLIIYRLRLQELD